MPGEGGLTGDTLGVGERIGYAQVPIEAHDPTTHRNALVALGVEPDRVRHRARPARCDGWWGRAPRSALVRSRYVRPLPRCLRLAPLHRAFSQAGLMGIHPCRSRGLFGAARSFPWAVPAVT